MRKKIDCRFEIPRSLRQHLEEIQRTDIVFLPALRDKRRIETAAK